MKIPIKSLLVGMKSSPKKKFIREWAFQMYDTIQLEGLERYDTLTRNEIKTLGVWGLIGGGTPDNLKDATKGLYKNKIIYEDN